MPTKAQKAIFRSVMNWVDRVGQPFQVEDLENLLTILRTCESDSIWGVAIRKVFAQGGDVGKLIVDLAGQAVDDPLTMADIVGVKGTTLLLKYYDTKNPA